MRVAVAVPWRAKPERLAAYEATVARWRSLLPSAPILSIDTDHYPYNLSAVRNEGVRRLEEIGAEVVIISDADCVLADDVDIHRVVDAARGGGLHLPYTAQVYLDPVDTAAVLDGDFSPRPGHPGNGACYVVCPTDWWYCGGGDERFSGWGGDDDGTVAAAQCLVGLTRHHGTVLSLWHADEYRPVGTPEHRPNSELARRYWSAVNDPDAMRRLIEERDG